MKKNKNLQDVLNQYPIEKVFIFNRGDHKYIIVGYPYLVAYIESLEGDFMVQVIPDICLRNRTIALSPDLKSKSTHHSDGDKTNIELFFNTIPNDLTVAISIYEDSHFLFLKAIIEIGDNFIRFMKENSILSYVLVNIEKFSKSFSLKSDINLLITKKRREILKLALFPDNERVVKIFSKIDPKEIRIKELAVLRNILNIKSSYYEKAVSILTHSNLITANTIRTLWKCNELLEIIGFNCFEEIARMKDSDILIRKLKYIRSESIKWKLPTNELNDLNDYYSYCERFENRLNRAKEKFNQFPKAPLKGTKSIIPLKTFEELSAHARSQKNCIRTFSEDVRDRSKYFYKVIYNKEEATLEILINGKELIKGDLLGKDNQRVSVDLLTLVNHWFEKAMNPQKVKIEEKINEDRKSATLFG